MWNLKAGGGGPEARGAPAELHRPEFNTRQNFKGSWRPQTTVLFLFKRVVEIFTVFFRGNLMVS